jgi:S1-C subfamily serine protease
LVGVTPYATDLEDYVVNPPHYLWSKFLNEPITLRIWKDGFLPKMVDLASGPFVWVNMNNTARKVYYVVRSTNVRVLLERDPRFVRVPAAPATAASTPPQPSSTTGTGFVLSASGYIATNYHVVKGSDRIDVKIPGRSTLLPGSLVVKDVGNDLAIIRADGIAPSDAPISFADPSTVRIGQDTFTLGFPLGDLMGSTVRLSTGTIDSLFGIDDDPRVYQISNPVQPGNSGGPLFNKDGQLIGIVVAQLDAKVLYESAGIIPQNVNFAVKASLLKNLVDTLPGGSEIQKRANSLSGVSREKQIEALTPSVVEIISHNEAPQPRSAVEARSTSQTPSIEGYSGDQVRTLLGLPSLTNQDPDGVTTWYYDTDHGTLKIFFFEGRASLRRQR